MKSISINGESATIQAGNRLGEVATALNAKGRALPHGTCQYGALDILSVSGRETDGKSMIQSVSVDMPHMAASASSQELGVLLSTASHLWKLSLRLELSSLLPLPKTAIYTS